jgi:hypothetical protein
MRLVSNLEVSYHLLPLTAAAALQHLAPHQLMWLHPDDAAAVAGPLLAACCSGWPEGGPGRLLQHAGGSRRVSRAQAPALAPQPSRLSSLLSLGAFQHSS